MAAKNPQTISKKWSNNLQGSTQQITESVQAVTTSPTQLAARKTDVMKARFIAAIDSGKVAAGLNRVTLPDWQHAMIAKGVPRIQQGATEGRPKVETFLTKFLPFAESVSQKIKSMPNATDADRKARMMANFDAMKGFKNT